MVEMLLDGFTETFASVLWYHSLIEEGVEIDEADAGHLDIQERTMVCIDIMAQQVPIRAFIQAAMARFQKVRHVTYVLPLQPILSVLIQCYFCYFYFIPPL